MVRVEDSALVDSYPPVPGLRTSYYFDPQGSDTVVITDDLNEKTLYKGLITGITTDADALIADKAAGEIYLDDTLGA